MGPRYVTRLGDGSAVRLSRDEIRREIEDGTATAAAKGRMSALEPAALDHLVDIFASSARFSACLLYTSPSPRD